MSAAAAQGGATADREHLATFLLALRPDETVTARLSAAVETVPRRQFVPEGVSDPYADRAWPIACGQTMPSARTVVRTVAALRVQPESRILEIGTGSGYATALLARLGLSVTTVERYRTLIERAAERVRACGLSNVAFVQDDGRDGHAAMAPFDRILVHASFETLPRAFVEQMASGAILVAPIGPPNGAQQLTRFQKLGSRFEEEPLFPVRLQPPERGMAQFL